VEEMKIKFILFLISILLLSSCNPYPIYNYEVNSLETEKFYYKGRQVILKEENGVRVALCYKDQVDNDLIFNISILNKTSDSIVIDPQSMFMEIEKADLSGFSNKNITKLYAKDPETQIVRLGKQIKNTKVEKFNSDMEDLAFSLGELIYDITELGTPKTSEELYAEYLISEEENQSYNLRNINYQQTLENLSKSKAYWENLVLRKTTLLPGKEISGFVHFPLDEEAVQVLIYLPIYKTDYLFRFSLISK